MTFLQSKMKADEDHHGMTAIAINGDKNSRCAIKWAVDNLINGNNSYCFLVYVQCKTLHMGENLGNLSKEGRPPIEQELQQFFLLYRRFCARRGVISSREIIRYTLHLKYKSFGYVLSTLLKTIPQSCAVYIISKGKVQNSQLASQPHHAHSTGSANSIGSLCSSLQNQSPSPPSGSNANDASTTKQQNYWKVSCLPIERLKSNKSSSSHFDTVSLMTFQGSRSSEGTLNRDSMLEISEFSGPQSFRSTNTSCENLEFSTASESSKSSNSSQLANLLDTEMRRLKLELQQSMQLFNSVTKEAVLAKHMEEKITKGVELSLMEMEKKKKNKVGLEEIQANQQKAEKRIQHQAKERRKTMEAMANNNFRCRTYTIDEIEVATNHFALSQKIGEGGYGPVFKGILNHINVDILSSMRHPHMIILLGACPEYGCLVHEFMENGSLEDRLFRKYKTPQIPWRARLRIAFEIATAILFLHKTKLELLVHRDLKPANILLDHNFVSKISDVGLARLLPSPIANNVSHYHMTAAAGTFYHIDPEYQQTGMLGVKSDVYSFGVDAINNGTFPDMLDKSLTDWPVKEALSLAKLAVKCCELRKKNRPDLASVVLLELKRLRSVALENEVVEHETINTTMQSY
ncbi:hypothetical protein P3X46_001572 [Hevea brasiliensis]|uniref:RING-type E3 ubiquitin transferase n=1 Tax=Hevea brasiliensis TaxID=3981 RepID=A0ABQ9NDP1_HEVBR|nr:hypothetical protein P3X46_001572 [Hevea brasiliensis]